MLAWLAGQDDLVEAFAKGEDVYKIMASAIYNKPVEEIVKEERFVGKTTILGSGYGMGGEKFQAQLKTFGVDVPLDECKRIVSVYRQTYEKIPQLWQAANNSLEAMILKRAASVGKEGVLQFDAEGCGFVLPNGLPLRYAELRKVMDVQGRPQYEYKTRMGYTKVYGGKVVENLCQALARCVIAEQMLKIGKRYKTVLTVHDAVACIAPKEEARVAQAYVEDCMRWTPAWATGLPLNCESGVAESYGEC
jgi:DNA polymerase